MYGQDYGTAPIPAPGPRGGSSSRRQRRHSPSRSRSGSRASPGRSGRSGSHGQSPGRSRRHVPSAYYGDGAPSSGRFIPEVEAEVPRSSNRTARSGQASGGAGGGFGGGGGAGSGLDSLERDYSSGRHRSPDRTRSAVRGVDRDPVPEDPPASTASRGSRRKPSPGRSARASPSGGNTAAAGVEGMQMVLLKQEESLALAARHGAEQEHVVDGLTEEIITLNHTSSELQLRNEHLLSHQGALEDEVVHLHSELTVTTEQKARLAAEVADLGSKLQRSRSQTEELAGLLEKVLFGADGREMDTAASKIQAQYRGRKTRKELPALPARDRHAGASAGAVPAPAVGGGAAAASGGSAAVASWGVADVVVWLKGVGMGQYSHLFESEHIDGPTLLLLGKDELAELGVRNGIHRAKIAAGAQKLAM